MLTKELGIAEYDFQRQLITPDRLLRQTHQHYVAIADELLQIYRDHVGETRRALHDRVRKCMSGVDDCPTRRIGAFCKLLDDASSYHRDQAGQAAKLRRRVYGLAAEKHPLVSVADTIFGCQEDAVKQEIAKELKLPWSEIESKLFTDVIEFHQLEAAPVDLDATGLLARYNVAQTQAALYGAVSMTIWARDDFKTILRYAKLARLMHLISRHEDEYRFHFNGPASIVRQTKRYGVAFAKFLPGLLSASDWRLQANVLGPANRRFAMRLSARDGLRSDVEHVEFDSEVEQKFSNAWQATETNGWLLKREATILHDGQSVFTPDFTLHHDRHGDVLLEIVGFWTPEYLKEKTNQLQRFQKQATIILAINETINEAISELGIPRVLYKTDLQPRQVCELLDAITPS